MQERHLYEYAIVRLVPRVERGEYINIGVVLYCKTLKTLNFLYKINEKRILALFPEIDLSEVENHLLSFDKICKATKDSGLIGQQDLASRFRWLTAKRSTIIQSSETHPGLCSEPQSAINKIFEEMVA
ncbi:DUF3037 domain-containing protein [Lacihabitans sp. LS3-19]|uniref:DUF3037 domain-containing protein n=1 Tax=Lacihabitans sp. LS3-19 TaxID=2487335 RepID=UPI0020CEE729|nr:DUF3037 domain-containing protein [Lacihabitans sp. LS3-19]MCP9768269.1 DUF3037 domain-containing protein [Lacihabitans sp. LS3-19]